MTDCNPLHPLFISTIYFSYAQMDSECEILRIIKINYIIIIIGKGGGGVEGKKRFLLLLYNSGIKRGQEG